MGWISGNLLIKSAARFQTVGKSDVISSCHQICAARDAHLTPFRCWTFFFSLDFFWIVSAAHIIIATKIAKTKDLQTWILPRSSSMLTPKVHAITARYEKNFFILPVFKFALTNVQIPEDKDNTHNQLF